MGYPAKKQTWAEPAPVTAITTADAFAGSYRNAKRASRALARLAADAHLVSPATSVATIPLGCEVAVSLVRVEASPMNVEIYPTKDPHGNTRYALTKVVLDRIAGALGVSWDARKSGIVGSTTNAYLVTYRAVGKVRLLDDSIVEVARIKRMDLREGSPAIATIRDDVARQNVARAAQGLAPKSADAQIAQLRKFILEHAETKACARVLRAFGVRSNYAIEELAKPFAVVRFVFTGRTGDPELEREAFRARLAASTMAIRTLYGVEPETRAEAPARQPAREPVTFDAPGADVPDEEALDEDEIWGPIVPRVAETDAAEAAALPAPGVMIVPFGRDKGRPITAVDLHGLRWLLGAFERSASDPSKARWAERNRELAELVQRELDRRETANREPDPAGGEPDFGDDDLPY